MLNQISTAEITLSATAAEAVHSIIREQHLDGYALRVFVASSGCCGVNFGMALDKNIRADDSTFEANGIRLVVDEISLGYLRGARIDFVQDAERGPAFVVESPNAPRHAPEHDEAGCACGASCSCHS